MDVCSITYDRKEQTATAKTVEVDFKKECNTQMVTVCEPKPAYGYHPPPPPPPRYRVTYLVGKNLPLT